MVSFSFLKISNNLNASKLFAQIAKPVFDHCVYIYIEICLPVLINGVGIPHTLSLIFVIKNPLELPFYHS